MNNHPENQPEAMDARSILEREFCHIDDIHQVNNNPQPTMPFIDEAEKPEWSENYMTCADISKLLEVPARTVRRIANDLFPRKAKRGKQRRFNEVQAAKILLSIRKNGLTSVGQNGQPLASPVGQNGHLRHNDADVSHKLRQSVAAAYQEQFQSENQPFQNEKLGNHSGEISAVKLNPAQLKAFADAISANAINIYRQGLKDGGRS